GCSRGCACSRVCSGSTRRKPCAQETDSVRTASRSYWRISSTSRWCRSSTPARRDTDSSRRCANSVATGSARPSASHCRRGTPAEIVSWAEASTAMSDAATHERFPVVLATVAYGRYVRGDLEGAIDFGNRAIDASAALGSDSSGLAERTLGNAWFYRGDVERT